MSEGDQIPVEFRILRLNDARGRHHIDKGEKIEAARMIGVESRAILESIHGYSKKHRAAMACVCRVQLDGVKGEKRTQRLRVALMLEERAAREVPVGREPTRSVLFRSAATIALQIGEYKKAQDLTRAGLRGTPPECVRQELIEVQADADREGGQG